MKKVYVFGLEDLRDNLDVSGAVFRSLGRLRPDASPETVTAEAAVELASVAQGLARRGVDPHEAAHFLYQVISRMFAEDIGPLPGNLVTRIVTRTCQDPGRFAGVCC